MFARLGLFLAQASLLAHGVRASPYVISDDRVKSLDVTPVLGRGYSIGTNTFQSTCLVVDATTVPSYNYDYYFTDYTKTDSEETALQGKVSGSFGYAGIKATIDASYNQTSKFKTKSYVVSATMRIERYYSSVREEQSHLTDDAKTLLDNQDYIGFFKACGPNYVRSIRRAQEVTAIFEFESSSRDEARNFAAGFTVQGWGQDASSSVSSDNTHSSMEQSLKIKIQGFGLGLTEDGANTLVATNMTQFNSVMQYAFRTMTDSDNGADIGMIYGIEVVPWVDNTAFQVAAKIDQAPVRIPMPRSLIPPSIPNSPNNELDWSEGERENFRCRDRFHSIDKFGYCCFPDQMVEDGSPAPDPNTGNDGEDGEAVAHSGQNAGEDYSRKICRPLRLLPPAMKKNNMSNNGEFVALLDSLVRYRMNLMFLLEKCISAVNALPARYDKYFLKAQDNVKYDRDIEARFTVAELKLALDPFGDYSLLKHMGSELDEFLQMYYEPCLSDLFGMSIGGTADTDPMYFMAESWYNHPSCTKLSCLADNMRWDRGSENGGCVPSLITGSPDALYEPAEREACALAEPEEGRNELVCATTTAELKGAQEDFHHCWQNNNSGGNRVVKSPVYLMDHFCLPQISADQVTDEARRNEIDAWKTECANRRSSAGNSEGGNASPS